jgi:hypothetical protein
LELDILIRVSYQNIYYFKSQALNQGLHVIHFEKVEGQVVVFLAEEIFYINALVALKDVEGKQKQAVLF